MILKKLLKNVAELEDGKHYTYKSVKLKKTANQTPEGPEEAKKRAKHAYNNATDDANNEEDNKLYDERGHVALFNTEGGGPKLL